MALAFSSSIIPITVNGCVPLGILSPRPERIRVDLLILDQLTASDTADANGVDLTGEHVASQDFFALVMLLKLWAVAILASYSPSDPLRR